MIQWKDARYADTLSPLTYGHDALVEIVGELDIQQRPTEDGTSYGDALALACARLDQMGQWQSDSGQHNGDELAAVRSKVVVLLTDGENNCGLHLPEEAAGLAKKWGIRTYAISMKDDERGSTGQERRDDEGLTDAEKLLRRLADETGGAYWKIGNATQLQEVYEQIDHLERSEIKTSILYHSEISTLFQYFAGAAFLLLLAEFEKSACCYSGLGELRKPAERVADEAVDALIKFVESGGAIDQYLADQILLPLSLVQGESQFHTCQVTSHLLTNAEIMRAFLPVEIDIQGEPGSPGLVRVRASGIPGNRASNKPANTSSDPSHERAA